MRQHADRQGGRPGYVGLNGAAGQAGTSGGPGSGGYSGQYLILNTGHNYGLFTLTSPDVGGAGGAGGDGGNGGVGVASVRTTIGNLSGYGVGGNGAPGGAGGAGGVGALLTGQVTNGTQITGGAGGSGGTGGSGGSGAQVYYFNQGYSGYTYTGSPGISSGGGNGGAGGVGVALDAVAGLQPLALDNAGVITGGAGGNGGNNGYQFFGGPTGAGGAGGVGVSLLGAATLTNESGASIVGGAGGAGGGAAYSQPAMHGGAGGAGVVLGDGATATNAGSITGGAGGDPGYIDGLYTTAGGTSRYAPGVGGAGVDLNVGSSLTNTGTITGGKGGENDFFEAGGAPLEFDGVGVQLDGGTLTNAGTISGGSHTEIPTAYVADAVDFGPGDGTLILESGARFVGDIGGFTFGDTIDVANLTPNQAAKDFGGSYIAVSAGSYEVAGGAGGDTLTTPSDGTLALTGNFSGDAFLITIHNSGAEIQLEAGVACYVRGTLILTPTGERPIESLRIGEPVCVESGGARPIRWIGRRRYSRAFAYGNLDVRPVRIAAGGLGEGLPRRDLWISSGHALYFGGLLIPASALVNGTTIKEADCEGDLEYVHLEFDGHEVIFAEGAASESYLDEHTRERFDNAWDYAERYPATGRPTPLAYAPILDAGEALQRVRDRLAAIAKTSDPVPMARLRFGRRRDGRP